jgi:hypothetical protein
MKKHLFYLSAIVFLVAFAESNGNPALSKLEYSHYDIQLKIIPAGQFIKVSGSLKYLVTRDSLDELSFNLHKKLVLSNFGINGDNSYQLDTSNTNVRWLPDAMRIVYLAKKIFHKGDVLNVEFAYEGRITEWPDWSANVITSDWVEIGLYFPWYPSIYDPFTYRVAVDIDPGYNVFGIGESTEEGNKKVFETDFPVDDFIICASKDLTVRETKLLNQSFKIVNCTLSDATVDSIQTDIDNIYRLYSSWFGKIQVPDMCLVISKRDKGGGYSRKGGLFLGGLSDSSYLNDRTDFIQYVAHEISHLWWHGAASNWEDWLNESFAEYSAMRVIKELRGEEEFNTKLNTKRTESSNTPPIWGMSRNDPLAEQVLYNKGVVLLNELEEKVGENRVLELCRARIDKKINSTADFLDTIKDIRGKEIADWFEQSLRSR